MIGIRLIFALAMPMLAGFLIVAWLLRDEQDIGIIEKMCMGFGLGFGLLSLGMFIMGLSGIQYTFSNIIIIPASLILFAVVAIYSLRTAAQGSLLFCAGADINPGFRLRIKQLLVIAAGIWIAAKIGFVIYEGLARPIYSWDTWANWSAGAKYFYYEKGLNLDPQSEFFFGRGYRAFLGHPLHLPLMQVWMSICLGEFHEIYSKAFSPFFFAGLLGMFFFAAKRDTSIYAAIIATLFLSSAPLLTYHGTDAYADLPLSYYAFAGVIAFWQYLKKRNRNFLILSGLFAGIAIFTKNEGVFFAAAIAFSLIVFMIVDKLRDKSAPLFFAIPMIAVAGPWVILKLYYGIGYGHNIAQKLIGFDDMIQAISEFEDVLFFEANFNLVFPFALLMIIMNMRAIIMMEIKYILMIILLVMAMFFSVYIMSHREFSESLVGRMAVNRNIITYLPIVYLFAANAAHRLWHGKSLQQLK